MSNSVTNGSKEKESSKNELWLHKWVTFQNKVLSGMATCVPLTLYLHLWPLWGEQSADQHFQNLHRISFSGFQATDSFPMATDSTCKCSCILIIIVVLVAQSMASNMKEKVSVDVHVWQRKCDLYIECLFCGEAAVKTHGPHSRPLTAQNSAVQTDIKLNHPVCNFYPALQRRRDPSGLSFSFHSIWLDLSSNTTCLNANRNMLNSIGDSFTWPDNLQIHLQ